MVVMVADRIVVRGGEGSLLYHETPLAPPSVDTLDLKIHSKKSTGEDPDDENHDDVSVWIQGETMRTGKNARSDLQTDRSEKEDVSMFDLWKVIRESFWRKDLSVMHEVYQRPEKRGGVVRYEIRKSVSHL